MQPGLLAIGCFATAGVTSWLAHRVAANERLARQRGCSLETQTRVNQLVIEDTHDGVVVDRAGRVVQHNPQAQRLLGEPPAARRAARQPGPDQPASPDVTGDIQVGGRDLRVRPLDSRVGEELSVLWPYAPG